MAISRKRLAAFNELLNDPKWVAEVLKRGEEARADPISFSALAYWLKLDTWSRDEGLLILAGLDPQSVIPSIVGMTFKGVDLWAFDTAQPFNRAPHFTLEPFGAPDRATYAGDDAGFERLLERAEDVNAVLDNHRETIRVLSHVLSRSTVGLGDQMPSDPMRWGQELYSPTRFIAWANSIKYRIPWLAWATERGLLGDEVGPYAAPFFDADATDYPELLAIAVRAWEHVRKLTAGTPKNRVLEYLAERYPAMPKGSRNAIAQVVNWQRTGGRPAKRTESGG
jgi:hypothetical protein